MEGTANTFKVSKVNPFAPSPGTDLKQGVVQVEPAPIEPTIDNPAEIVLGDIIKDKDTLVVTEDTTIVTEPVVEATPATIPTENTKDEVVETDDGEESDLAGLYYKAALQMKEDGYLADSVELTEETTADAVYNAFVEANRTKLRQEVEDTTRNEVMQSLRESGVTQEDLQHAMISRAMVKRGEDPAILSSKTKYEVYSKMDPKDTSEDKMLSVIKEGLIEGGLKENRADKYISALELEGEDSITEEFKEQQGIFKNKYDDFVSTELKHADQLQAQQDQVRKNNDEFVSDVFTKGEIYDEPISPSQLTELREGMTQATEVVEINGQKHQATEFQKFVHELKDDLPTQLYLYKIVKYRREELDSVESKARQNLEKDFLGRVPIEVKDGKGNKSKPLKNKSLNKSKDLFNFGKKLV